MIFCVELNDGLNNKEVAETNMDKRFVHGRSLDDLLKQYAADLNLESGSDGDLSNESDNESGNDDDGVDKRFVHGRGLIFDDNDADEDFNE